MDLSFSVFVQVEYFFLNEEVSYLGLKSILIIISTLFIFIILIYFYKQINSMHIMNKLTRFNYKIITLDSFDVLFYHRNYVLMHILFEYIICPFIIVFFRANFEISLSLLIIF